jgi:hypothetical protein
MVAFYGCPALWGQAIFTDRPNIAITNAFQSAALEARRGHSLQQER